MRDVLAEEHPDCAVSLSSDVLQRVPRVRARGDHARRRVRQAARGRLRALDRGPARPAVLHHEEQRRGDRGQRGGARSRSRRSSPARPPARSGAALVAEQAGFDKVITLDGGGTSTDVAVITGGRPSLTTEGSVGRFAVKVPMVDVITVGTGGGSIAWVSPEGTLKVGPRSAGAESRAGLLRATAATEPTTTDAFLLLGHIPEHLLGGEIPLDRAAAEAVYDRLAESVGLALEACAAGVLEIAAWNQANAIRQVTVKRGLDVRDFDLCAFGGSGPLTACRLIDILGLRTVVRPARPRQPERVRAAGHRPAQRPRADAGAAPRPARPRRAGARVRAARGVGARRRRGPRRLDRALRRPALLRAGVRDPRRPRPTAPSTRRSSSRSRRASTTPTSARTATATATTPARSSSG